MRLVLPVLSLAGMLLAAIVAAPTAVPAAPVAEQLTLL